MDEMKFEILSNLVSVPSGNWNIELNLISWNGGTPKYDLRKWNADHTKMSKGIGFDESTFRQLLEKLKEVNV